MCSCLWQQIKLRQMIECFGDGGMGEISFFELAFDLTPCLLFLGKQAVIDKSVEWHRDVGPSTQPHDRSVLRLEF